MMLISVLGITLSLSSSFCADDSDYDYELVINEVFDFDDATDTTPKVFTASKTATSQTNNATSQMPNSITNCVLMFLSNFLSAIYYFKY